MKTKKLFPKKHPKGSLILQTFSLPFLKRNSTFLSSWIICHIGVFLPPQEEEWNYTWYKQITAAPANTGICTFSCTCCTYIFKAKETKSRMKFEICSNLSSFNITGLNKHLLINNELKCYMADFYSQCAYLFDERMKYYCCHLKLYMYFPNSESLYATFGNAPSTKLFVFAY